MLRQAAPDNCLIQTRDVLREMFESLRRMEVQEQSEVSAMQIEIHQRHRLPLARLLHRNREIRGDRARAYPAPRADDADDPPRLRLCAGLSPVESLLKAREGRLDILAGQRLREKLFDSNPKPLQKHLWIRP